MKTYSFRIFPNKQQIDELIELSCISQEIWNLFIERQQQEYETNKKLKTTFDLHKELTIKKKEEGFIHWQKLNSKACQRIVEGIDFAYKSFFNLIKKDPTAKPPQIKEIDRTKFKTLTFNQSGWSFKKDENIEINKIRIKYKTHLKNVQELNIKEFRVKKIGNKWICDLCVEEKIVLPEQMFIKNKVLAIDMGLEKLATGIGSDGRVIILNNKAKKISVYYSNIINEIKSRQSKKVKFSREWKHLQKRKKQFYHKKNSQVKQALHIQSKNLANMDYNTIIIGDLQIKKLMQKQDNKNTKVSRSFGNSNLSMFMDMLKYKCEHKQKNVQKINEWNTTQLNSLTGKLFKIKVELKDRVVQLSEDIFIDRDLNSAINIYNRWYENHIAVMTPPLDLLSVFAKNNLKSVLNKEFIIS